MKQKHRRISARDMGITLVSLVVTIIVILILAAITLYMVFRNGGIIDKAREGVRAYEEATEDELMEIDKLGEVIDSNIPLVPDIADIDDIPDIDDSIDLPAKRSEDELIGLGYIPIYTVDHFKEIARGKQNYKIYNLSGVDKGNYNMNVNAKYALMNDIDFSGVNDLESIPQFEGELEGNGCTISNVTIYGQRSDSLYGKVPNKISDGYEADHSSGIIEYAINAKVQNMLIDESTLSSSDTTGAYIGHSSGVDMYNCYVRDSVITGSKNAGGFIGSTIYNQNKLTKCKNIRTLCTGGGESAGIVGHVWGNVELDNCKFLNNENQNGVVGLINRVALKYNSNIEANIIIKDSGAQNIIVNQNYEGGLVGTMDCYYNSSKVKNAIFENCTLKNSTITGYVCGGIISSVTNVENIEFKGCRTQDLTLGGYNCGGIVGAKYNGNTKIENCTSKNIRLVARPNDSYFSVANAGGIAGDMYSSSYEDVIKNCKVQNVFGLHNCIGGIIGHYNGQIVNIEQCTAKDLEFYSNSNSSFTNKGGIVGEIGVYSGSIAIKDSYSQNLKSVGKNIGGMIGKAYGSFTIEKCGSKNIDATASQIGGMIAVSLSSSEANIKNCVSEELYAQLTGEQYYGYREVAGILAFIDGSGEVNIQDCYTKNLTSKNALQFGGIVCMKYGGGIMTIKNCNVLNINADLNQPQQYQNSNYYALGTIGGILGMNSTTVKIINCKVSTMKASGEKYHSGGIMGYQSESANADINNCKVNNIDIQLEQIPQGASTGGIVGGTVSDSETTINNNIASDIKISKGAHAGGIIGFSSYASNLTIKNNIVKELEIETELTESEQLGYSGGIIGNCFNTRTIIENNNIKKVDITSDGGAAGVIGYNYIGSNDVEVKNCEVSDMKANSPNIGGIVSLGDNDSAKDNQITITDCYILNMNGELKESSRSAFVHGGGISGYMNAKAQIKDCNTENTKITTDTINGNKYIKIGGIISESKLNDVEVDKCSVRGFETEIDASDSYVFIGGIAGRSAEIENCNVSNSTIKNESAQNSYTGGIVGHGGYDSVSAIIRNCSISDSTVSGINEVGGICGAIAQMVDNCTAENTTVRGTGNYVAGIIGTVTNGGSLNKCNVKNCKIYGNQEKDYLAARKRTSGGTDKDYTEVDCNVDNQSTLNSL